VVLSLKRVAVGRVTLDPALAPGQWRDLTDLELSSFSPTDREMSIKKGSLK